MIYRLGRLRAWACARLYGYFWLPCPICRRSFSGHESRGQLMTSKDGGLMLCGSIECMAVAAKRNQAKQEHFEVNSWQAFQRENYSRAQDQLYSGYRLQEQDMLYGEE